MSEPVRLSYLLGEVFGRQLADRAAAGNPGADNPAYQSEVRTASGTHRCEVRTVSGTYRAAADRL